MSFITAVIIVSDYFNRKRAIATGIAMSGSGFGTFVYAYLTNFLIQTYDWRGTILILSGLLLNGVVCGAIYRPLSSNSSARCSVCCAAPASAADSSFCGTLKSYKALFFDKIFVLLLLTDVCWTGTYTNFISTYLIM